MPKGDGIYVRVDNDTDNTKKLLSQEVVLNDFFNIAFDIAGDDACQSFYAARSASTMPDLSRATVEDLVMNDLAGANRQNVTQPDGFFFSSKTLIAVELKLDSVNSAQSDCQVLGNYALRGGNSGKRDNLGLLFIVPEKSQKSIFSKIGMKGALIDADVIARLKQVQLSARLRTSPDELTAIAKRVRLASVSWTWLRDRLTQIRSELDSRKRGDQFCYVCSKGCPNRSKNTGKTGIPRLPDGSS